MAHRGWHAKSWSIESMGFPLSFRYFAMEGRMNGRDVQVPSSVLSANARSSYKVRAFNHSRYWSTDERSKDLRHYPFIAGGKKAIADEYVERGFEPICWSLSQLRVRRDSVILAHLPRPQMFHLRRPGDTYTACGREIPGNDKGAHILPHTVARTGCCDICDRAIGWEKSGVASIDVSGLKVQAA